MYLCIDCWRILFYGFIVVFEIVVNNTTLQTTVYYSTITHFLSWRTIGISNLSDTFETNFIIEFISDIYYIYNWIIRPILV